MMVDIRSIAGSSRPGQGNEQEGTSHSTAARSRWTSACDATTTVVAIAAAMHWQHSVKMAAITPLAARPKGTLEVTHTLLHNSPI
jgi:hypothetical protein